MSRLLVLGGVLIALFAIAPLIGVANFLQNPPPTLIEPLTFTEIVTSANFLKLIKTTLKLSLLVGFFSITVGGWLAWTEVRTNYVGHKYLHVLGLLPLAMPSYILAATLGPAGWVGETMGFGQISGFWPAVLTLGIVTVPYTQLTVSAALRRISASEEDAARTLGATSLQRFKLCVWPKIRGSVAFSFLISFLYALSDFGAVAILNVPVLTWRLYSAILRPDFFAAAILSIPLILAAIPCLFLVHHIGGKSRTEQFVANPRKPDQLQLGIPAQVLSYFFHFLIIGVGLVIPLLTLGEWVWSGYKQSIPFASPLESLAVSTVIAIVGAAVTVGFAIVPAWLSARTKRGHWLTQLTYLSSALPGVLLAFGLLSFCLLITKYFEWRDAYILLSSSGILLCIGYAMRFLAEAFSPLRSGVDQLDPRHKESALTLGASPARWLFRIALPQLRPNFAAAYLIAFIAILKELPITLILAPTGYNTLAFRIWDRGEEALWHDAGLHGLLLVGLALAMTIFTLRWRRYSG